MKTIGLAGVTALASMMASGCDDERIITVHANRAALVAIDLGDGWASHPAGDIVFAEPAGVYRIAVTCRLDTGYTGFVVAGPGDPSERQSNCPEPSPDGAEVTLDITGVVSSVFIGDVPTYGSATGRPIHVAPGTYDVVATQVEGIAGTTRVQILRDVVIDGPTRVAIDVTGHGAALEPFEVLPADGYLRAYVSGTTARGTWFQLYARAPGRLPASMRVEGDEQWVDVRGWSVVAADAPLYPRVIAAVGDGPVEVVMPTTDAASTFTAGPPPTMAWSSHDGWDSIGFALAQDNEYGVPGWAMRVSRRALELGAAVAFPEPPPPGWRPAWNVDTAGYHRWSTDMRRARADGGWEQVERLGGVYDPAPPPRVR